MNNIINNNINDTIDKGKITLEVLDKQREKLKSIETTNTNINQNIEYSNNLIKKMTYATYNISKNIYNYIFNTNSNKSEILQEELNEEINEDDKNIVKESTNKNLNNNTKLLESVLTIKNINLEISDELDNQNLLLEKLNKETIESNLNIKYTTSKINYLLR